MAKQWLEWLEVSGAPKLDVIVSALLNGELDTFHDHLYGTIIKDLSFNDVGGSTSGKRAEAFYYAYLMGWLAHARYIRCNVKSNREGGLGHNDALIKHPEKRRAALLKFKVKKKEGSLPLEGKAASVLDQIECKQYCHIVSVDIGATSGSRNCIPREVGVLRGKIYKKCDGKWVKESEYNGMIKGIVENGDMRFVGDNDNDL